MKPWSQLTMRVPSRVCINVPSEPNWVFKRKPIHSHI
jgi:hypothetical protein